MRSWTLRGQRLRVLDVLCRRRRAMRRDPTSALVGPFLAFSVVAWVVLLWQGIVDPPVVYVDEADLQPVVSQYRGVSFWALFPMVWGLASCAVFTVLFMVLEEDEEGL